MTHIDSISLFGHAHKLKIIKLTNKQYQNCISTGLVITGQNVFDWTQNSKGKHLPACAQQAFRSP